MGTYNFLVSYDVSDNTNRDNIRNLFVNFSRYS